MTAMRIATDDNGDMKTTMSSGGFGSGALAWTTRIVLACSAAVMGVACAPVTSAVDRFECVALHGGSPSNGNMGAFDGACASGVPADRLLLAVLGFCVIVLVESVIVWLPRRFPEANCATRLIGTGWTPFLLYGFGVWLTHGLVSGAWFDAGNSWLPVAEAVAGANAVAAWNIEGLRTLTRDRDEGLATPVSRIGADTAKRNVVLCGAAVAVLTATRFGDLGLVIAGTGVPVLAMWVVVPVGALVVSLLLRRVDSPSGYGKVLIVQQLTTLLCAAAMCVACLSDASRIVGLMTA